MGENRANINSNNPIAPIATVLSDENTNIISRIAINESDYTIKDNSGTQSYHYHNASDIKNGTFGNITPEGVVTASAALENGDALIFADSSDSNKLTKSSITIGTNTATYLRNDGTWATPSDTHYSSDLIVATSATGTVAAATTTNANTYLSHIENGSATNGIQLQGSGGTTVSYNGKGKVITIDSPTYLDATTDVSGLMSTSDKIKLNGIGYNSGANAITNNLYHTQISTGDASGLSIKNEEILGGAIGANLRIENSVNSTSSEDASLDIFNTYASNSSYLSIANKYRNSESYPYMDSSIKLSGSTSIMQSGIELLIGDYSGTSQNVGFYYQAGLYNFSPTATGNKSISLGLSTKLWSDVYSKNGTIQTSDRSEKSDIKLISQETESIVKPLMMARTFSATNNNAVEDVSISRQDILDFFKRVEIYTYVMDDSNSITVKDAIDNNEYAKIHIGVMADDIENDKLFPYVGYRDTQNEEAPLGMKYADLSTLSLYAIRDLYSTIEELKDENASLKAKLESISNN